MNATAISPEEELWAARRIAQGLKGSTGYKHDATGTPATTGYLHGPGGLLTFPGVDPSVFQTIVGPLPGVLSSIPTKGSEYTHLVYEVMTGITAGSGSEPTDVCDPGPVGGTLKAGKIWAPFGRYTRSTREIEINRLGQRNDRADPMDLSLVGNPLNGSPFAGMGSDVPGDILQSEISAVMWERAVEFHRLLSRQIWTGNPTNNNASGAYKEMAGLELLVTTGHVDAETGVSLPSLDSDIKQFGYGNVAGNGDALVNALTYMVRTREDLASRTGVAPVRFVFVMRESLFYEVTKVWPCSYMTAICDTATGDGAFRFNIDQGDQIAMRDDMRANRYLLIDGKRYPVILDDGIPVETPTTSANVTEGCQASDIYLLPMSVLGGRSTLYLEYFRYTNNDISRVLNDRLVLARALSGGAFLETILQTVWCVQWTAKIEPRLVLRTPWLAGRLQDVMWCPLQNTRDPYPDDPYFVNGGNTTRSGPSYYSPWAS